MADDADDTPDNKKAEWKSLLDEGLLFEADETFKPAVIWHLGAQTDGNIGLPDYQITFEAVEKAQPFRAIPELLVRVAPADPSQPRSEVRRYNEEAS